MSIFTLTETEFFRLLHQGEEDKRENLHIHYLDFVLKVTEVCHTTPDKHSAINALLFVEVEINHLLTQAQRDEVNAVLTDYINKALAFVRSKIEHIKGLDFKPASDSDTLQDVDLKWSANKTDIVELAYAFKVADCFGPKAKVKHIVAKLAKVFNVDIPENYIYKKSSEFQIRTGNSRSHFLDFLGEQFRNFLSKKDEE